MIVLGISQFFVDVNATMLALVFLVAVGIIWTLLRQWKKPHLYVSNLSDFNLETKTLREKFAQAPQMILFCGLLFFVLAYIDPHQFVLRKIDDSVESNRQRIPTEGIAIYLVLDNSQSMLEKVTAVTPTGEQSTVTKMDVLRDVTKQFVRGEKEVNLKGRNNDLLGIVTFARSAQVISPLTLDHKNILHQLKKLDVNRDESQRGTALGYAIFKTANLIEATRHFSQDQIQKGDPAYEIKNSVIVLVTDGFQETNPEDFTNPLRSIDLVESMNYAKDVGIRVYIVNIDPKITSDKFADHRKFFRLLTEMTGGDFFYVDNTRDLAEIYAKIDQLEKSSLSEHSHGDMENLPSLYERVSYYPYLIGAGMFAITLFVILQTTLLRRVP